MIEWLFQIQKQPLFLLIHFRDFLTLCEELMQHPFANGCAVNFNA
jgi:hypothetical protein